MRRANTLRPTPLLLAAACALAAATPAAAEEASFSVNIGAASDYVFRGVSQTDENPQVFGGADVEKGLFYAGTWVTNVDFNDSTDLEYDLYAGVRPKWGAVSFDFGVLYYGYLDAPSGSDLDYVELQAKASVPVGPATLGVALVHSPNSYGHVDHATYYEANASYALNDKLSLSGAVGRQTFSGTGDYATWNVGAGYALNDTLGVDLRYHDTDRHRLGKTYGSRVVVSLKAAF